MRRGRTFFPLPDSVRLHYRIQGHPGGPWLILLNGLLSDMTMWAGVLPHLTPRFHVLTVDGRGQGPSDAPRGAAYAVPQHAEDVRRLLDHLEIERPWLVGLSNGANIALELLVERPGGFAGAVLNSSVPRIDFATRLKVLHWIQCLQVGGPLLQFDAAAPYLWGDSWLAQRHGVLRSYHQVIAVGRGRAKERPEGLEGEDPFLGAANQMKGILDWDLSDHLGAVRDPILLLAGAEDLLTPPWKCLETAQRIAHARFEIVPGIGHAWPVEDPKAFAERVLAFVDETGA